MSVASINGVPASRCVVQIPSYGAWWADVDLTEAEELAGAVSLVVGSATLAGTVMSGGASNGRAYYRIAAGAGGWGKTIGPLGYANDAGVKASVVAGDAARLAGEMVSGLPTTKPAGHYARAEGPASAVLHALFPRDWYVGLDGVTRSPVRASVVVQTDAPRTRVDLAAGTLELATEDPSPFVPGVIVDSHPAATDVEWEITADRATARLMFGRPRARRLDAFARLLEALDPRARFRGLTEYRVVSRVNDRYNLQVVRASSGMPDLARVPDRTLAGIDSVLELGTRVLVAFIEGAPWLPAIVSQAALGEAGWMPQEIRLGEAPLLGVARITDTVQAGPFAGAVTSGSARVRAGM